MPKRIFPFEYDFLPQCKVHVSEKEVNMGALMDHRMQAIYDKTRALLYKGSRESVHHQYLTPKLTMENEKCKSRQYKQTFLDNSCQIQSSGCVQTSEVKHCEQCKTVVLPVDKCSFCDKKLCRSCLSVCMKCEDEFCRNCSMNVFIEHDDRTVCLGCYD